MSFLRASVSSWFVLLLACSATRGQLPQFTLSYDTTVDKNAWNFPDGKWGTTVNGQTYQQEAVITHNGYQYAAYFAEGGILSIARRELKGGLSSGDWQRIHFPDYKAKDHRNTHNVVAMGISGDGAIHLTFDHHCNELHYRRSIPGLATDPKAAKWSPESFGPITNTLDGVTKIPDLTYPLTFSTPTGNLQLLYRTGYSGSGDWHLWEYANGSWTKLNTLFSKEGSFQSSPTRCAYPNPVRYDANGRLHITWTWRETPEGQPLDLRTNHDLCYAYSEDQGRSWKNTAGESLQLPITISSPGIIAVPTKFLWGQMNTTTQTQDSTNRPHVINWQQPPDAAESSKDLNTWRFYHLYQDATGKWQTNKLPFFGRKPQLVFDKDDNAYVVVVKGADSNYHNSDPGGALTIQAATKASNWTDWTPVYQSTRLSVGEPLLDQTRWAKEQVLSVYLQDKPSTPGAPSALRVMDFELKR